MASKRICEPAMAVFGACTRRARLSQPRSFLPRAMTTEASSIPAQAVDKAFDHVQLSSLAPPPAPDNDTFQQPPPPASAAPVASTPYRPPPNPFLTRATCSLHAFPSLEPTTFTTYPGSHLLLPLRRDILHRAVVYEGDATRQGTASTKWRSEVHGSNRKIRPQKGLGKARLGDKKSPMLKGGGVAFGPKPRDFSTGLPQKVYDLAWRTALSYRYRRGELVVLDGRAEIERDGPGTSRWMKELLDWNQMGHADGRSLFVTVDVRENLFTALELPGMGRQAKALVVDDVDVKDLLELGRIVIEKRALDRIFRDHSSDLKTKVTTVA
ncbi:hypothetical protein MBLNU459_g4751t1 [Dothideomycetes sp. NU459]